MGHDVAQYLQAFNEKVMFVPFKAGKEGIVFDINSKVKPLQQFSYKLDPPDPAINIGRAAAGEYTGLFLKDWLDKGDEKDEHRKPLEWNALRIRAVGGHIQAWLNGEKIVDYTDPDPAPELVRSGVIALQTYGAEGHAGVLPVSGGTGPPADAPREAVRPERETSGGHAAGVEQSRAHPSGKAHREGLQGGDRPHLSDCLGPGQRRRAQSVPALLCRRAPPHRHGDSRPRYRFAVVCTALTRATVWTTPPRAFDYCPMPPM